MVDRQLAKMLVERAELVRMMAEMKAEVDKMDEQIKTEMVDRAVQEMLIDGFKVSYKEVTSNRFDSKLFKSDLGDSLYNKYCVPQTCMRFQVR